MATAGDKIKHIRNSRKPKLTQLELAEKLGVKSRDIIANYENNRTEPEEAHIRKLARLWGIDDPEWFWDGGDVEPPSPQRHLAPGQQPPAPYPKTATLGTGRRLYPVVGVAGAAAFPIETQDPDDWVEFSDELYRPDRFAIRLVGDSMEPRIPDESYILVQPHKRPPVGLITVVRNAEHEYAVKVRRIIDGMERLLPVNTDYEEIQPSEGWEIVGYAVAWRKERVKGKGKYIEEGDNDGLRP